MENVIVHFKRLSVFARIALIVASASIGNAPLAMAGDAAARRVIGFSPSGNHFAFEQYTTLYDSLDDIVRIEMIDTTRDAFVKGTSITMKNNERDGHDLARTAQRGGAKDGAQTFAVLIGTVDAHKVHAGPNRRFMAVTHRLP